MTYQSQEEHASQREGDKFFYDIYYKNGEIMRIFNPIRVVFKSEESPQSKE